MSSLISKKLQKDEVLNVTYFAGNGCFSDKIGMSQDNVGWGLDYIDPSTYLDILKPSVGESTKTYLGFDAGTK